MKELCYPRNSYKSAHGLSRIPLDKKLKTQSDARELTYVAAINEAVRAVLTEQTEAFVAGEDVAGAGSVFGYYNGLLDEFGAERVIDTPISEEGIVGLGVGAAATGLRPIIDIMFMDFIGECMDEITNQMAKMRYMFGGTAHLPITVLTMSGAGISMAAQHSQSLEAWLCHLPGLKVVMPYTAADAKGLLKAAIRDPNPVIFLENEILYGQTFDVPKMDDFVLPIGKARIHKKGKDATLVSFGIGMTYAIKAAEALAGEGIDVELIDLRTIRPMDLPTIIESVKKTGRLVTVEEGYPQNSVGTEIATRVMQQAFDYLDAPVLTIAGKDVPMPYAANLEKLALPSVAEVVEAVKTVCYKA